MAAILLTPFAPAEVKANPASPYDSLLQNEPRLYFELPRHAAGSGALDLAARDPFAALLSGPTSERRALSLGTGLGREPGYVLNATERAALRGELEQQLTRSNPAATLSTIQPLAMGGERDIRNFYADAMRGGQQALDFNFTIQAPVRPRAAAAQGGSEEQPDSQQAAARAELEAVGQELLRPALQARQLLQDATRDLRKFILMQEPMTAQMTMLDGESGHALVMSVGPIEEQAEKRKERGENGKAIVPRGPVDSALAAPRHRARDNTERPPLGVLLWQILTDRLAFVLYGLIGLCWATWRYLLSRYA